MRTAHGQELEARADHGGPAMQIVLTDDSRDAGHRLSRANLVDGAEAHPEHVARAPDGLVDAHVQAGDADVPLARPCRSFDSADADPKVAIDAARSPRFRRSGPVESPLPAGIGALVIHFAI